MDCPTCDSLMESWETGQPECTDCMLVRAIDEKLQAEAQVAELREALAAECKRHRDDRKAAGKALMHWEEMANTLREQRDAAIGEVERLRGKNSELNRRCQRAESVANENVEACKRAGQSFGRGLANYAALDYMRRLEAVEGGES